MQSVRPGFLVLKLYLTYGSTSLPLPHTELRTGIGLIVNTFGDRLAKFRFPTHVARELQKFADYAPQS